MDIACLLAKLLGSMFPFLYYPYVAFSVAVVLTFECS